LAKTTKGHSSTVMATIIGHVGSRGQVHIRLWFMAAREKLIYKHLYLTGGAWVWTKWPATSVHVVNSISGWGLRLHERHWFIKDHIGTVLVEHGFAGAASGKVERDTLRWHEGDSSAAIRRWFGCPRTGLHFWRRQFMKTGYLMGTFAKLCNCNRRLNTRRNNSFIVWDL